MIATRNKAPLVLLSGTASISTSTDPSSSSQSSQISTVTMWRTQLLLQSGKPGEIIGDDFVSSCSETFRFTKETLEWCLCKIELSQSCQVLYETTFKIHSRWLVYSWMVRVKGTIV